MPTKIMKWLTARLTALLWRPSRSYRFIVGYGITVSAIAVLIRAVRARRYLWVLVPLLIAVLVNPIRPVELPPGLSFWLDVACLGAFSISLRALTKWPALSIPLVTDRTSESESL